MVPPIGTRETCVFNEINMLGRYAFTLPDTVARGELRPLRDPRTAGVDEA
jgi:hypothetical protein